MSKYYPINEDLARRAKEMNSFYDYVPGSATAEYQRMVDEAAEIAEQQKRRVDPMYHERIDQLLDLYAKKLAENVNQRHSIDTRCPSILIAGGSNFPVRKKEKQNAAWDRNSEEFSYIQGLLSKIRSTGMEGEGRCQAGRTGLYPGGNQAASGAGLLWPHRLPRL